MDAKKIEYFHKDMARRYTENALVDVVFDVMKGMSLDAVLRHTFNDGRELTVQFVKDYVANRGFVTEPYIQAPHKIGDEWFPLVRLLDGLAWGGYDQALKVLKGEANGARS